MCLQQGMSLCMSVGGAWTFSAPVLRACIFCGKQIHVTPTHMYVGCFVRVRIICIIVVSRTLSFTHTFSIHTKRKRKKLKRKEKRKKRKESRRRAALPALFSQWDVQ
jgi:hypothetical protein